jgi:hypothetical protein
MATLDENIAEFGKSLSDARKSIINAISATGVSCPADTKLSDLPDKIKQIAGEIQVDKIAHTSVYDTVNVVGTSTNDGKTILNTGTLIVSGGFGGNGYANHESLHWVKVYINKELKYTFEGTNSVSSFIHTISVTKGQTLYIQAHARKDGDSHWNCSGAVTVQLVYLPS